jgi:PAS domain S-box-containing protein
MHSLDRGLKWLATTLSPEGIITSLSAGSEQLTGYSAEELVGKPITEILADSSAFELIRILDAVKQWGHWEGKIVHRTREGKSFEAQSALSLLAGAENHSSAYLLFSSTKKTSIVLPQADSAGAEVEERLRAFIHDLNNPLAVMMGFTQLLSMNSNCQGTMRTDVEKLYSELKRVIQVVASLQEYAIYLREKPKIAVNT